MKPTAPENFDGDATTGRLDPTWKAQVDLSRLESTRLTGLVKKCFSFRFFFKNAAKNYMMLLLFKLTTTA